MTTVETPRHRYRAPSQPKGHFTGKNRTMSGAESSRNAEVIHLNQTGDSTRNTTPMFDGSYVSPPPVTVPYGWTLREERGGWSLVHDRHEWSVISWLIQERRAGRSYGALAEELVRDRVPAPTGGRSVGRWHTERVRTLVLLYAPDLAAPRRAERGDRLAQLHSRSLSELTDDERAELEELEAAVSAVYEDEHADDEP